MTSVFQLLHVWHCGMAPLHFYSLPCSPPSPRLLPVQTRWEVRLFFLYTRGGAAGDTVTAEEAARSAHAKMQRKVCGGRKGGRESRRGR